MIVHFLLLLQITTPQGSLPEVVTRSRLDRSRGVDFHALVTPDTVYVGQQSTYQLGVFIDQETRQRIRRNPEFVPPESYGLLSYDLPDRGATRLPHDRRVPAADHRPESLRGSHDRAAGGHGPRGAAEAGRG